MAPLGPAAQMTEREMLREQVAEMEANLAGRSNAAVPVPALVPSSGAAQLNMPAATEVSSQPALSSQGSAPGVQLSLSRQASLCNRIAELQAKLTREEAQEPNNSHASALLNSSGAPPGGPPYLVSPTGAGPTGVQYVPRQQVPDAQQYAARNLPDQETYKMAGAERGGPGYGVQATAAYTQGPTGFVSGYPVQGQPGYPSAFPVAQDSKAAPALGYGQGPIQAYPNQGFDNQRNFSGAANDVRAWIDAILFGLGFVLGIPWLVGACLPLCRRPRWRTGINMGFWVANVVMSIVLVVAIIVAAVVTANTRSDNNDGYYYYYG